MYKCCFCQNVYEWYIGLYEKRKPIKVKINADITEKYFDPEWDENKVQEVVAEALELYFANGE